MLCLRHGSTVCQPLPGRSMCCLQDGAAAAEARAAEEQELNTQHEARMCLRGRIVSTQTCVCLCEKEAYAIIFLT